MPYLVAGGAKAFKHDTMIEVSPGIMVSGSNLKPIIDTLDHYEAVMGMGQEEQQKALCSILSKCHTWRLTKASKLTEASHKMAASSEEAPGTVKRSRVIQALMQEVMATLNAFDRTLTAAVELYQRNKSGGTKAAAKPLSLGYANERGAYLNFNKDKSLSASLIDDFLFKSTDREMRKLPAKAEEKFKEKYRRKKELPELTLGDWEKIAKVSQEVTDHQLEVRYMRKFERLKYMLESDGAGGLRYVVGQRSAHSAPGVWAYAMDEWGNIFTADDQLQANKNGYAMFNHSSFTSGDNVIGAGMIKIDSAGKVIQIDNSSGHYKPTKPQLQAVVTMLQTDYAVDLSKATIALFEPNPQPGRPPIQSEWNPGHSVTFLNGGLADRVV